MLDVSESRKQDETYFAPLVSELNNGGRVAMLHDLLAHPVDWAALRHPPDTDAKRDLKSRSMSADERWLITWLMDDHDQWTSRQARSAVYDNYNGSFKGHAQQPKSVDGLGRFFKMIFRRAGARAYWPRGGKMSHSGRRVNAWEFPALGEFRSIVDAALGTRTDWPPEGDIPANQPRLPDQEDDVPF